MSLAGSEELGHITGPALAGVIADDIGTNSKWQTLDREALTQLAKRKWMVTHQPNEWQPLEAVTEREVQNLSTDMDL